MFLTLEHLVSNISLIVSPPPTVLNSTYIYLLHSKQCGSKVTFKPLANHLLLLIAFHTLHAN